MGVRPIRIMDMPLLARQSGRVTIAFTPFLGDNRDAKACGECGCDDKGRAGGHCAMLPRRFLPR